MKTAFATTSSKSQWNIAPFSVCSLSGVFCCLMSQILSGLDLCFAYLDDILVWSTKWKEHVWHHDMVFKCLKEENLKIKFSKCQFFKKYLYYLGHLTSEQGIQLLPEKNISNRKVKGTQ